MKLSILGCDPSFTNFGMAHAVIDTDTMSIEPTRLTLIRTKKESTKRVLVSSDDLRRIGEIHDGFIESSKEVDMIMSEIPSGGAKSHAAAKALAYSTAILGCADKPLVQLTPSQVKVAAVGDKHASKAEMIQWGRQTYPHLNWTNTLKDEHLADSLAAIHAGIESEQFLMAYAMMARGLSK